MDDRTGETMPVTKRIVILANSVKHDPGRCIAGRELFESGDGHLRVGDWVRPVSTEGEGELQPAHTRVNDGKPIQVLDILDVTLLSPGKDPSQPENWIVDASAPWRRIRRWQGRLGELVESPDALWLQPLPKPTDRATREYVQAHPPAQSLYFLQLSGASFHRNLWGKLRLGFDYHETHYDLAVTDPIAKDRLMREHRGHAELKQLHVCVSLAPAFKGDHYKVAATLLW